ncbi:ribosome-assembly protein 3-domain-containing protein [Scheffersomyces coipomensis]|uniref:ribosome-assembly protein 3-domain-containing protein n=1 Tax=Scheffersomyces coipomensis TaxID=1788519 RepID=UPI00315C8486
MAPSMKKSSRRRKKRRTEDFSSDSDSDSDSNSSVQNTSTTNNNDNNNNDDSIIIDNDNTTNQPDINLNDIDIDSDSEKSHNKPDPLTPNIHKQLNTIKLTTNQLTQNNHSISSIPKGIDTTSITNQINQDQIQLNNQYLKLMTTEFNQNLDELRKKPDFNDKSLIILAKALQNGGNLFDKSIIDELLDNKN